MEEDVKGNSLPDASRVSAAPPMTTATTNKETTNAANNTSTKESIASMKRQMFTVELKPGQTTIVSWKKLCKEEKNKNQNYDNSAVMEAVNAGPGSGPATAHPPVPPAEGEQDVQPSNRFSSVIEKIERLYMGKHSSDEEELDDTPDDDQYDTEDSFIDDAELDEYFQVDKLSTKHDGYFVNRGKLEGIESSSSPNLAPKKRGRKDSTTVETENRSAHVKKDPKVRSKVAAREVPLSGTKLQNPVEIQTVSREHNQEGKLMKNKQNTSSGTCKKNLLDNSTIPDPHVKTTKGFDNHKTAPTHKVKVETDSLDLLHHASPQKVHVESSSKKLLNYENEAEKQPSSTRMKDGSVIKHKSTSLERAIRDLEKIVALCRPPKVNVVDINPQSQVVKRRLPQDVKQKLAKVARLSVNQSKMSKEVLMDRLMGIVGHIIQRRSLKRNMREMIESSQSVKPEKIDKFQQIKNEVDEMIRARVTLLKSRAEQQDGSADDFQVNGDEGKKVLRKNAMDNALEDKICELYDLYAEKMEDSKCFQSKKIYGELAELWPSGYVDINTIKDAISRSKDRKRSRLYRDKIRDEEKMKRKKLAAAVKLEETNVGSTIHQPIKEKVLAQMTEKIDNTSPQTTKHYEKAGVGSTSTSTATEETKKKLKRKSETDLSEVHHHQTKVPNHENGIRLSSQNKTENPEAFIQLLKPEVQLPKPVLSDQQS